MRFFSIFKSKAAIKIICTTAAMICAMTLVCSVCSGSEATEDNSVIVIAYDDRCADTEQIEDDLRYLIIKATPLFLQANSLKASKARQNCRQKR